MERIKGQRKLAYRGSLAFVTIALVMQAAAYAGGSSSFDLIISETSDGATQSDVRKLGVGKQIERELRGGESHTYEIEIEAGQFLNAVVEQRGIDVVVNVIAPDGKQLMEVDSPNGAQGPEPVKLISEATGNYKLIVRSSENSASAGKYEIHVLELRLTTENDRNLLEAERLKQEVGRLSESGRYNDALRLAEHALAIRQKSLGTEHPDVVDSLTTIVELYLYKGDYETAKPLAERALEIGEKVFGSDRPEIVTLLDSLALIHKKKGDYAKAEVLYHRALSIAEKTLGPDDPDLAVLLFNFAALCTEKGDHARAEMLLQRSLAIKEKVFGPDHPTVSLALSALGYFYFDKKKDLAKAELMLQHALVIQEKTLGQDHPEVAYSLSSLAGVYKDKGEHAKAELFLKRGLTILEKAFGIEHPDVATFLANFAMFYRETGDYAKAKSIYDRVLAIERKTLGPAHPDVALSLNSLAVVYEAMGDITRALECRVSTNDISERNLLLNIVSGSERQKLLYLATLFERTNNTISFQTQSAPDNSAALSLAIATVLRRKGRALDAMIDSFGLLRHRFNSQDRSLFDRLTDTYSRLATLVLKGPGNNSLAQMQTDVERLNAEVEKIETDISSRSAEFRAQLQPVTLQSVQKAIPQGMAVVEYVWYRPFKAKYTKREDAYGAPRYVAYLIHSGKQPTWIDLGPAESINKKIAALREALRDKRRQDVKRLARAVDQDVMQPVRKMLGGTHHVLISPDSALNLIPFAALVDEQNHYLVQRYRFTYLTSGRDLLRLQEKTRSKSTPLVIADADFNSIGIGDKASDKIDGTNAANESGGATDGHLGPKLGEVEFEPLKRLAGSAGEASEVKRALEHAVVLTRGKATEAAIKQVSAPSILHIATHGFFLEKEVKPGSRISSSTRIAVRRKTDDSAGVINLENPALRSGLFFAGANRGKSGDDDGVLTALEAAGLDLWGTKLVVLSACDTGVGEVLNGEGVQGLRRALVLAGSESQMMSLWPVSDTGTRELMIEYYRRLKAGEGRSDALRQVQLRMLTNPKRRHPFYWASFIQSGEWASLEGKR